MPGRKLVSPAVYVCCLQLRKFDKESEHFSMLSEVEIAFQPSYPFSEDVQQGRKYMQKRCPAWCDRILMNTEALKFVEEASHFT
jgi:inositol-1,4,5-trisphosphate 5-phosphatase